MPFLRGFLIGAVMIALVVLALLVAGFIADRLARRFGVDWRELRAYRERERLYREHLRQLEAQLPPLEVTSPEFEQASHTLHAFQQTAPEPPRWAFWLQERGR
ncbi:hypothetical protein D3C78_1358730 [compost metagenome]